MSKLYDKYLELKACDYSKLYLFKSGIFYIFLAEDANIVSNTLGLKLTKFNDTVCKCGFPISASTKYCELLKIANFSFEIVDVSNNQKYTINEYSTSNQISKLLEKINSIDIDNISIKEAYELLSEIKVIASSIKV